MPFLPKTCSTAHLHRPLVFAIGLPVMSRKPQIGNKKLPFTQRIKLQTYGRCCNLAKSQYKARLLHSVKCVCGSPVLEVFTDTIVLLALQCTDLVEIGVTMLRQHQAGGVGVCPCDSVSPNLRIILYPKASVSMSLISYSWDSSCISLCFLKTHHLLYHF